jgi:hypothetical protein
VNLYVRLTRSLRLALSPFDGPMIRLSWIDRLWLWMGLSCRWCHGTGEVRLHRPPLFNNCTVGCPCKASPGVGSTTAKG